MNAELPPGTRVRYEEGYDGVTIGTVVGAVCVNDDMPQTKIRLDRKNSKGCIYEYATFPPKPIY